MSFWYKDLIYFFPQKMKEDRGVLKQALAPCTAPHARGRPKCKAAQSSKELLRLPQQHLYVS